MTPRERNLLAITLAVVGGAAGVTFGLEPALARWRELSAKREALARDVAQDEALAREVRALGREQHALLGALAPPEGEAIVPWLADHVRALTREAGFEPAALRYVSARALPAPGGKGEAGPFSELRFELEARTTLSRLQTFCVALAASDRAMRVAAFSLAPERKGDELTAQLTLVALAPAEAAGGAGAAR